MFIKHTLNYAGKVITHFLRVEFDIYVESS